jgi:hypothetical protein
VVGVVDRPGDVRVGVVGVEGVVVADSFRFLAGRKGAVLPAGFLVGVVCGAAICAAFTSSLVGVLLTVLLAEEVTVVASDGSMIMVPPINFAFGRNPTMRPRFNFNTSTVETRADHAMDSTVSSSSAECGWGAAVSRTAHHCVLDSVYFN